MDRKWLPAIERTVFQLAALHLLIIAFQAIRTGDFSLVQLASIFDLEFFFDNLSNSLLVNVLLVVPVSLLFLYNFVISRTTK